MGRKRIEPAEPIEWVWRHIGARKPQQHVVALPGNRSQGAPPVIQLLCGREVWLNYDGPKVGEVQHASEASLDLPVCGLCETKLARHLAKAEPALSIVEPEPGASVPLAEGVAARRRLADGEMREIRMRLDLSLSEVAQAVGCSVSALSRWERGLSSPSLLEARTLVRALDAANVESVRQVPEVAAG